MEKRDVLADTTARQEAETVLQLAPGVPLDAAHRPARCGARRRRTDSFPPVLRPLAIMVE